MTNEELIAKIKAEIERRIDILSKVSVEEAKKGNFDMSHYYHGKDVALEELLSFLSTLESEKPIELEEEVKRYYSENFEYLSSDQPTLSILTNVARHFTELQYQKDRGKFAQIKAKTWSEGFDACKEQMMKGAVEADVNTYRDLVARKSWAEFVVEMPTNNLGDKVRIIIVKD